MGIQNAVPIEIRFRNKEKIILNKITEEMKVLAKEIENRLYDITSTGEKQFRLF
ncbi:MULTISPECIES: hypothetical protein [Psychrilyobacter]|uniref:hypothetical protein n=1 Tax=Psychrilyobacter TaxID=623282 RepID=UPI0013143FBF|nr:MULTISPECIES: hypothetical protein [Psychrilyobacter]MCS5422209.1 hypothetical protein [Psychrilyobacter sp. S5]NDI77143.1 hypothetical protein [Psychrilyobacter piezotolerans]